MAEPVGAGAGRQARLGELGGGRMGKGESFSCDELRTFFTIL